MRANFASSYGLPSASELKRRSSRSRKSNASLRANIPATELETIVSSTGILSQGRSSFSIPIRAPTPLSIQVYLADPAKRTRNQVEIMNDVRPKIVKLFPGVSDVFRSGGARQTRHQLRLAKGRGRGNLWI